MFLQWARPLCGSSPARHCPSPLKAAKAGGPLNTDEGGMWLLRHLPLLERPLEVAERGEKDGDTLLMGDCSPAVSQLGLHPSSHLGLKNQPSPHPSQPPPAPEQELVSRV